MGKSRRAVCHIGHASLRNPAVQAAALSTGFMDKTLIRSRFSRAMDSYGEFAGAQRDIADKMCRKICALPEFGHTGLSPLEYRQQKRK